MPVTVPLKPNGTAAFSLTLITRSSNSNVASLSGGMDPKYSDGYNKIENTIKVFFFSK